MALKKIYAETSQHTAGAYYGTGINTTPGNHAQHEILVRAAGKPDDSVIWFAYDEWALVLRGISRAKAEAIVMILNAPEPNE